MKKQAHKVPNPAKGENGEMSGVLQKMGVVNKSFKERWFVLDDSRLYYYKSPKHSASIDYIPVDKSFIRISHEFLPQYCFELVTPSRVYQLIAPNEQQMKKWVAALEPYSKVVRENELIRKAEEEIHETERQKASLLHSDDPVPNRTFSMLAYAGNTAVSIPSSNGNAANGSKQSPTESTSNSISPGNSINSVAESMNNTFAEEIDLSTIVYSQEFFSTSSLLDGSSVAMRDEELEIENQQQEMNMSP